MSTGQIVIIMQAIMFAAILLSVIYAIGVVWRVEQELDISYKLLLAAIVIFGAEEIMQIIVGSANIPLMEYIVGAKMVFALFLLAAVFTMRDLIRKIDGEKE
jgi:hypothetical protein